MKTLRLLAHFLLICLLSGCTTMKAVEEVGNSISKGNIIMGTLGILTVPGAMVIDVFTLGGTLSADEAAGAWGAGIDVYASSVNSNESARSSIGSTSVSHTQQPYIPASTSNYRSPSSLSNNTSGHTRESGGPAQINVGSASQASGTSNSSSGRKSFTGISSSSKLQSKDATHCVEIVPRDFKGCQYKRCIHNACGLEKISVWWDGGMIDLSPKRNWPVNAMADNGGPVRYKACAWDKRAGHSPQSDPCRYN